MDNVVSLEPRDPKDLEETPDLLDPLVQLEHLDSQETKVVLDLRVLKDLLGLLDHRDPEVKVDSQVNLDRKDLVEILVHLDLVDLVVNQGNLDHKDPVVHQEKEDPLDPLVSIIFIHDSS